MTAADPLLYTFDVYQRENGDIVKITREGWQGILYIIPRSELVTYHELEDHVDYKSLSHNGVYFLINRNQDEKLIYIGQCGERTSGEPLLSRVSEHDRNPEKDFWNELIFITDRSNELDPTKLNFLEKHFWELARDARRYTVRNKKAPNGSRLKGHALYNTKKVYADDVIVLMKLLCYFMFEPLPQGADKKTASVPVPPSPEENPPHDRLSGERFYIEAKKSSLNVTCLRKDDNHYVLLKGSLIKAPAGSLSKQGKRLHKELRDKRMLTEEPSGLFSLQQDLLFESPSAIASFALGRSANGNKELIHEITHRPLSELNGK